MQTVVQKWGNSLGLRIPSLWAKDNNVRSGSFIEKAAEEEINSVVDNIKLMIE